MQNQQTPETVSPCNGKCVMDSKTNLCSGCFRTIEEIIGWISFSDKQKFEILTSVAERKRKLLHSRN